MEKSLHGAVNVIRCNDRITDETIQPLSNILEECCADGKPMAVLNLEKTQLINSAGLEFLLDAGEQFMRRRGHLKLAAPTDLCREVLDLTQVDQQLEVFSNVSNAVRSFVQ